MIIYNQNDNYRKTAYICPNFDFQSGSIKLKTISTTQVRDNSGAWIDIPESVRTQEYGVTDDVLIDTGTMVIDLVNGVPAYTYFLSVTGTQLGMTDLGQPIFNSIKTVVETFIEANGILS